MKRRQFLTGILGLPLVRKIPFLKRKGPFYARSFADVLRSGSVSYASLKAAHDSYLKASPKLYDDELPFTQMDEIYDSPSPEKAG